MRKNDEQAGDVQAVAACRAMPICVGAAHTQEHPREAGPATTLGTLLHFYLLSYECYALLDHVILVIPLTRPINAAVTNVDDVGTVLLHL